MAWVAADESRMDEIVRRMKRMREPDGIEEETAFMMIAIHLLEFEDRRRGHY